MSRGTTECLGVKVASSLVGFLNPENNLVWKCCNNSTSTESVNDVQLLLANITLSGTSPCHELNKDLVSLQYLARIDREMNPTTSSVLLNTGVCPTCTVHTSFEPFMARKMFLPFRRFGIDHAEDLRS